MIILTLAWALGAVASDLKTANYLVSILGDALPPAILPAILFVIAAAVSFAVGDELGHDGHSYAPGRAAGVDRFAEQRYGEPRQLLHHVCHYRNGAGRQRVGATTAPRSPTPPSSLRWPRGSDHIDHVRTQIPYALTVGFAALLLGLIPAGFGITPWITLPIGAVILVAVLFVFGTKVEDRSGEGDQEQEQEEEEAAAETTS